MGSARVFELLFWKTITLLHQPFFHTLFLAKVLQIMTKILVIYYSQSGSVWQAAQSLLSPLESLSDIEITWQKISPEVDYSYPWKLYQFFDVFPECINQEVSAIKTPNFDPNEQFDLVVLAYQVWYLAPSLPIQGFLKSEYAKVLKNTKIITLICCRNMWHSASEIMKNMIKDVGGIHIDNIVVTHQGSPLITFITTPRMVLTGKKDSLRGLAGIRAKWDTMQRFVKMLAICNVLWLRNRKPYFSEAEYNTYSP